MAKKKTTKKAEPKNTDALSTITKAITKKYGNVVKKASENEGKIIPTVSTGSIRLDVALGRGGMAFGRTYEISGPNSGGKSTLAANIVAQAQARGLKCCYVDAEHAVDASLFKNYGVNIDDLILIQGYNGEENLDILEMYVQSGEIAVAVVDSVSSLIPGVEAEAEIGDTLMAPLARLMNKACRRLTPIAGRTGCLIIFINQLREKIQPFGNPEITTGGNALGFHTTGRITVRGPEAISRRIKDQDGEIIGHKTLFEVTKNKLAAPFKKAEVKLIYGKGYDVHWEVLDMAVELGIIDKLGNWYKYPEDNNIANGEQAAVVFLKENEDIYKEVRAQVIEMIGLKEIYEQNS
jgi:recombination protein RecA